MDGNRRRHIESATIIYQKENSPAARATSIGCVCSLPILIAAVRIVGEVVRCFAAVLGIDRERRRV